MDDYGDGGKRQRKLDDDHPNAIETKSMDRLSLLPDPILASILSLLPIKSAASAAVLSSRWRHLWTSVTAIRYVSHNFRYRKFFSVAADHILPYLTSPAIDDAQFHGPIPSLDAIDDFLSFICQLCGLHVKKLEVIFGNPRFSIPMHPSVFETVSLETLVLGEGFNFTLPDNGITLPNLRILRVTMSVDNIEFMEHLFKSCPSLEDLRVDGRLVGSDEYLINITCQNLKRLCVSICVYTFFEVVIDAPKLECFHVGGSNYVRYCFASAIRSLSQVEVSTWNVSGLGNAWRRWDLLRSIHHIRTLSVCHTALHDWYRVNGVLPCFQDMKELRVSLVFPVCWKGLMRLLHNCPSLEVLGIRREGLNWDNMNWSLVDSLPTCLSTNVKRIEIWDEWGDRSDLELVKFILNVAEVLETLIVSGTGACLDSYESDFYQKLCKFPRSSPTCQIRFACELLHASRKAQQNWSF